MIIGIPHYNDFEGLKECIISLLDSAQLNDDNDTLLIINADERYTNQIQNFYLSLNKEFRIIQLEIENKGPLYAYNQLFRIAKERKSDLFLTQSDVTFPKRKADWLKDMKEISKIENCGMITCFAGGGTSGPTFIDGFPWVGAWCTYIPFRTIEKLGGYDDNIPLGYAVDIDYTYAVLKAGLKIYIINYWVDHHPNYVDNHKHEHVENFQELKEEAFRYMKKKWNLPEYSRWNYGGGIDELDRQSIN